MKKQHQSKRFLHMSFFGCIFAESFISKPFQNRSQPFQETSQKFTFFKIITQESSQPFSGLVTPPHLPPIRIGTSLEPHWNLIGTSLESDWNIIGTSPNDCHEFLVLSTRDLYRFLMSIWSKSFSHNSKFLIQN